MLRKMPSRAKLVADMNGIAETLLAAAPGTFAQNLRGLWALQGEQGAVLENGQRAILQLGGQMGEVGPFGSAVDDEKEPLAPGFVIEPRHHQIVENMPMAIEQLRIAHPPPRKGRDIARHQRLQPARSIWPGKYSLAHMRNIEKPSSRAREKMFADDARGILHGHGIAGKTGHAGAESTMQIVKRRAGELANGGGGLAIGHRNTWPGKVMACA